MTSLACQQSCVKSSDASNGEIKEDPRGTGQTCQITSSSLTRSI
jgi:hypothetical protein